MTGASAGMTGAGGGMTGAGGPDYFLIDAASPGSGETFDWKALESPGIPLEGQFLAGKPWFLAGGLGLRNIDAALALNPWGVDISSGAETGGKKDRAKMIALVEKIKKMI